MMVYMKVSDDRYQLPLAVAGSQAELARLLGVSPQCIHDAISRTRRGIYKSSQYVAVDIGADDEVEGV